MAVIPKSAYTVVRPSAAGDIVGIRLDNTDAQAEAARVVSFGQTFAKGDLPNGTALVAKVAGQLVPLQVDVKATHPDGSAKHAILTLKAPPVGAGASVDVMLSKGQATSGTPVSLADALTKGYDLGLKVALYNANGTKTTLTVDADAALKQALANGSVEYWMKGPLATEGRVSVPINDQLTATFDIRVHADGQVRADVQVHYDWAYKTPMSNVKYDVQIIQNGKVAFAKTGLDHHHHADWHKQVWSGAEPDLHIVRDPEYVGKSGAVPSYDLGLAHQDNQYAEQYASMTAGTADIGPMGHAFVEMYMPMTGNRQDIGPLPSWAAQYVASQDPRAYAVMMANADAAGSIPWHFRSETTKKPVTIDEHPKLWIDARGANANAYGADALKWAYETKTSTGWTPDVAHHPSLTYLPYLLSGDHYYLDELQSQASFTLATMNPGAGYRDGSHGYVDEQQIRAQAWIMRTLGDAVWASPDGDKMKAYFTDKLNQNFDNFKKTYIDGGAWDKAGQLEGFMMVTEAKLQTVSSPWQDDYVTQAFGTLAQRGFTKAQDMLNWKMNYEAGRFINEDLGFNPYFGADYKPTIRGGTEASPGAFFTSWKQLFDVNYGDMAPRTEFLPGVFGYGGYAPNAYAALANLVSSTNHPDAVEAFGFVASVLNVSDPMNKQYSLDPKFSVAPKLADGTVLHRSQVKILGNDANTVTGTDASDLLHGRGGNDTLTGGGGIDLLFGGDGNDVLRGGTGNDFLFGGNGTDTLYGDAGDDVLRGKMGADKLYGGDGNDILYYDAEDTLDGGTGFDTVAVMNWRNGSINLNSGRLTGIQRLTLDNGIADTVTVGMANILKVSETGSLYINGEKTDSVSVTGTSRTSDVSLDGVRYAHYTGAGAHLYVEVGMKLNGTAIASGTLASGATTTTTATPTPTSGTPTTDTTPPPEPVSTAPEPTATPTPPPPSDSTGGTSTSTYPTPTLTGTAGADTLTGTSGNDVIDGRGGSDTMRGGAGNDTYYVDRATDQVVEALGAGTDTILTSAPTTRLAANVERLELMNGTAAREGIGNAKANTLIGNDADNILRGGSGDDILDGRGGADVLYGNDGRDVFLYSDTADGRDRVADFTIGQDILDLRGAAEGDASATVKQTTAGAEIWFDADGAGGADAAAVVLLSGIDGAKLVLGKDIWIG